jgi:hypothetical protein
MHTLFIISFADWTWLKSTKQAARYINPGVSLSPSTPECVYVSIYICMYIYACKHTQVMWWCYLNDIFMVYIYIYIYIYIYNMFCIISMTSLCYIYIEHVMNYLGDIFMWYIYIYIYIYNMLCIIWVTSLCYIYI